MRQIKRVARPKVAPKSPTKSSITKSPTKSPTRPTKAKVVRKVSIKSKPSLSKRKSLTPPKGTKLRPTTPIRIPRVRKTISAKVVPPPVDLTLRRIQLKSPGKVSRPIRKKSKESLSELKEVIATIDPVKLRIKGEDPPGDYYPRRELLMKAELLNMRIPARTKYEDIVISVRQKINEVYPKRRFADEAIEYEDEES